MFSDALDASFIGPNPAINGYAKSKGEALRIVAGTTSGGASLVVSEDINTAADLKGKTLATPVARQHPGRRPALRGSRSRASRPTPAAAATCASPRRRTPTRCNAF